MKKRLSDFSLIENFKTQFKAKY